MKDSINNQKSAGKIKFLLMLLSIAVGVILFIFLINKYGDFNPDNVGLGLNTTTVINYSESSALNAIPDENLSNTFDEVVEYVVKDSSNYQVIWIGASQLHAINDYHPGEKLAYHVANYENMQDGVLHTQFTTSNAGLHDILGMFLYILRKGAVPDLIVIPLVYDDLRERAIQQRIIKDIKEEDLLKLSKNTSEHFRQALSNTNRTNYGVSSSDVIIDETPQKELEDWIIKSFGTIYPRFKKRKAVVSRLIADYFIYSEKVYSAVYGSVSASGGIRYPRISDSLKKWNLCALNDIVRIADEYNIRCLFYRQPIRPTSSSFYHELPEYDHFYFEQVEKFKRDSNKVYFADLHGLVPVNLWGVTNINEPDVFHFKKEGHQLLGEKISKLTRDILSK